jgi:hypothetical protein
MDLKELKDLAKTAQAEHPHWRPGQAAFNVVYRYEPAIADQIRTTTADPFHVTTRLPAFWRRVEELLTSRGEGKEGCLNGESGDLGARGENR